MYTDEAIIQQRNAEKQRVLISIDNEVEIGGTSYTFAPRELLQGALTMTLPEQMEEMERHRAALKYPSERRPELIFTDESGAVNFTYSYLQKVILYDHNISTAMEDMQAVQQRLNPANVFEEDGELETVNNIVSYFSFRSYGFEEDLFNCTYVTNIDKKMLIGNFTCLYGDRELWSRLVKQMLGTITDNTRTDDQQGEE